jgi:hypothetical protein
MAYDRMSEYIETILHIYIMVLKMTRTAINNANNDKLKCISSVIYNYVSKLATDNGVDLSKINVIKDSKHGKMDINLVTFFEYIAHNNIELYDFNKIDESDMDVNNAADVERFVLSHIYYLTQ